MHAWSVIFKEHECTKMLRLCMLHCKKILVIGGDRSFVVLMGQIVNVTVHFSDHNSVMFTVCLIFDHLLFKSL